ncbi:MAG: hypothetical protein LBO03_01445 [Acidaminococcales bacterium]|jgi:uncharacterized membrane protein YcgQ (UPF0703/DUF1980 family)|nr:hypothetical protein [Acidaminococcales bacterium]
MKKALCLLAFCLALCAGCQKSGDADANATIEIKDHMFIGQINDIYVNLKDYAGKKIKLQGIFGQAADKDTGRPLYSVYRQTPGCCGNDGIAGLEVVWDKEGKYPAKDAWVEATGILEVLTLKEEGGLIRYPRLRLVSLRLPEKEGARFVTK